MNWKDIPCKLWTKHLVRGYGMIQRDNKRLLVHRIAWEEAYGTIPDNMLVCHHCDVRNCIEPAHLFLGTTKDNAVDRNNKHRTSMHLAVLTVDEVQEIRDMIEEGYSNVEIAERFMVEKTTISDIKRGKTWAWLE